MYELGLLTDDASSSEAMMSDAIVITALEVAEPVRNIRGIVILQEIASYLPSAVYDCVRLRDLHR